MELENCSPLIITSMHRSGSSLTASLLQSAGLHIGQRLMAGNQSNVKGYFENFDFLDFHKAVLRSHEITDKGWTVQESIEVDDRFVETAKEIIQRNAIAPNWGWKEPRTTLFLDFWGNLLPKAQFLFIYRAPWEVVDSLYRRREDKPFQRNPDLAIKLWLHYNRQILKFYNRFPHRCLLASIYSITGDPSQYIDGINQKFDRDLTSPNCELYDVNLLAIQSAAEYRASLINHYFPEAIQLYRELDARGWYPESAPPLLWEEKLHGTPYGFWVLQDWEKNCGWECENTQLKSERHESKLNLKQLGKELQFVQKNHSKKNQNLEKLKENLELKSDKLERTEKRLEESKTRLHALDSMLAQTQTRLNETEAKIALQQEKIARQELDLHRWELRERIRRETQEPHTIEYQTLVWDAWRAYRDRNFEDMVQFLKKSMEYAPVARSEMVLSWLESFQSFSQDSDRSFTIESLVSSEAWQQLLKIIKFRHIYI